MTNKQQIQELIARVDKILANCQQEYSDRPIPPYIFSDVLKECETALQEYQKVMDRVESTDGLVEAIGGVEVCTGYDRCYPPNEYYESLSEVMSKEEITKYIKAIQNYVRGKDD